MRIVSLFTSIIAALLLAGLALAHPKPPKAFGDTHYDTTWRNPVNRNLIRLAICETGGINGGRPLWTHQNSTYGGALGFALSTWAQFRVYVRPLPPQYAWDASPAQQLAVGRHLVRLYGYSPWPVCSIRLGLR
jgi:hypothetical protein